MGSKHYPLSENIYQRLLRRILDGAIPAGARLKEEQLSADLGVSRTPLREALIRLAREGILEQQPRHGCRVRALPENEIAQLMECRTLLETLVVRQWFDRIDRDRVRKLAEQLARIPADAGPDARQALLAADEEMHAIIAAACANRFLAEQLEHLLLQCRPYRVLRCAEAEDWTAVRQERRAIAEAILQDRREEAAAGLAAHFANCLRFYCPEPEGDGKC